MDKKNANNNAEEIEDKEDVIETQNEGETDKEDVIEDQNDDIEGKDDAIMKRLDGFAAELESIRGDIKRVSDMASAFVDSGAVIREGDVNDLDVDNDGDPDFVPIEELDLNL